MQGSWAGWTRPAWALPGQRVDGWAPGPHLAVRLPGLPSPPLPPIPASPHRCLAHLSPGTLFPRLSSKTGALSYHPPPTANEHCDGSLRPQDPQSPLSKHIILILSHHSTLWYLLFPPRRSFLCSVSQECRNHMKRSPALFREPPAPPAELAPLG